MKSLVSFYFYKCSKSCTYITLFVLQQVDGQPSGLTTLLAKTLNINIYSLINRITYCALPSFSALSLGFTKKMHFIYNFFILLDYAKMMLSGVSVAQYLHIITAIITHYYTFKIQIILCFPKLWSTASLSYQMKFVAYSNSKVYIKFFT